MLNVWHRCMHTFLVRDNNTSDNLREQMIDESESWARSNGSEKTTTDDASWSFLKGHRQSSRHNLQEVLHCAT